MRSGSFVYLTTLPVVSFAVLIGSIIDNLQLCGEKGQ